MKIENYAHFTHWRPFRYAMGGFSRQNLMVVKGEKRFHHGDRPAGDSGTDRRY